MKQELRESDAQGLQNQGLQNGSKPEGTVDTDRAETFVVAGLPAYNEEVGIGSVILGCQKFVDEVVVVDDGSTDRTVEVAEAAGATVIEHETNKGKGAAVKTLFKYVENSDADVFVMLDADGQHLPTDIENVTKPVIQNGADLVVGSRYLEQKDDDETPGYRRIGQRILDYLTLGSNGGKMTDTQSGFRAFSPAAIDQIELSTNGIGVESEMISDAMSKELTIEEVDISVRYDGIDGQTLNPVHHGMAVVQSIISLIRDKRPLLFFSVPGLALVFIGTLYGLDGILIYRATGQFYPAKVFVAGMLTILGSISTFAGLMLNSISRTIENIHKEK